MSASTTSAMMANFKRFALLLGLFCSVSCDSAKRPEETSVPPENNAPVSALPENQAREQDDSKPELEEFPGPRFQNRAGELGIEFVYDNGAFGRWLMTESTGGGAGWLDYDLD